VKEEHCSFASGFALIEFVSLYNVKIATAIAAAVSRRLASRQAGILPVYVT
jgi:hypothetical protein